MKKFFTLILLSGSILFSSAQNFDDAGVYMQHIGQQQENISKKFMSYASASAHGKRARKVENLRQKLLNEVQEARMNISGMPSFKGDKSYRDTAVNFMKLYFHILNDDYNKVLNLEEIAEQSYDEMEALLMVKEVIDQKLQEGNNRFILAQKTFAASNNINLIDSESELESKLKKVSALNKYYNEVYLLFFKPYMQDQNLVKDITKENITSIEQTRNALKQYAEEGLEKLKSVKSFEGDNSVIGACRSMLQFYVKEAGMVSGITDFVLAKENFEKVKKDFERSKKEKADVDAYNKAVNEMNAASSKFNQTISEMNKQRTENLNNWNKTVRQFFDEHTPRYK